MTKKTKPVFEPTPKDREIVEALAGFGIPILKIASVIGCSQPTLQKVCQRELDRGAAMVEAKLVGNLLRLAGGTDGTALKAIMFSLQCRFGWSQYMPAPPPRPEPLGKKAQALIDAEHAHEGTSWAELMQMH